MPLPGTDNLLTFDPKTQQEHTGFNEALALMKLQQQNNQFAAKQQQQDMSMLLRAMGSPSGNASWIGHTAMPQQPTFAPRQGMFSGILSDPWHQYLAQKEYEVRRDRAIANQMDELYRRDSNDRFDQLLALMQARGTPEQATINGTASKPTTDNGAPAKEQPKSSRDVLISRFRQFAGLDNKDSEATMGLDAALEQAAASVRADPEFINALYREGYSPSSIETIKNNPLAHYGWDKTKDYKETLTRHNFGNPYGKALAESFSNSAKYDETDDSYKAVYDILNNMDSGLVEQHKDWEPLYRGVLRTLGVTTQPNNLTNFQKELAASAINWASSQPDVDIDSLKELAKEGDFGAWEKFFNSDKGNVSSAFNLFKQKINTSDFKNRADIDNMYKEFDVAYDNAGSANVFKNLGIINPNDYEKLRRRYDTLTNYNPMEYITMNELTRTKGIIDARRLLGGFNQNKSIKDLNRDTGSNVYSDIMAKLTDRNSILNNTKMQKYFEDPNNFKRFLESSYFYGLRNKYSSSSKPEDKNKLSVLDHEIKTITDQFYKARLPESTNIDNVVKNIKTRLAKNFNDNASFFENAPDDKGELITDLLAAAEGYKDQVFPDSNGKGVYLLSVTNDYNWKLDQAQIGKKFSELPAEVQNKGYGHQLNAIQTNWGTVTRRLHSNNVKPYIKGMSKQDLDEVTALLASSAYRGDSTRESLLVDAFKSAQKLAGNGKVTPLLVYQEYTKELIKRYNDKGKKSNISVVTSRFKNVKKAYNAYKNKTK